MSHSSTVAIVGVLFASILAGASNASVRGSASEPTVETVYSFTGNNGTSDGNAPFAPLLHDGRGEFYGTTGYGGGSSNCAGGCGTVFKVNADGTETVLHSFTGGSDGARPNAGLVKGRNGFLYGTTEYGGDGAGCQSATFVQAIQYTGCGTVFSLSPTGELKIVYAFTGVDGDGWNLLGGVVEDRSGNLFGATTNGGSDDAGTIFEISPDGTERVLYSFSGGADGSQPYAGVTIGTDGDLYGSTNSGGESGLGTLFKIAPDGTEVVLHSFGGGPVDGAYPGFGLLLGHDGNFYGSSAFGGALGYGCLFKITPTGELSILYSFTTGVQGTAGANGPLVENAKGDIYGTTEYGGSAGYGSVFELSRNNKFTTLASLPGYPAGVGNPTAGVVLGKDGWLYGTSSLGGGYDGGTVFRVRKGKKRKS